MQECQEKNEPDVFTIYFIFHKSNGKCDMVRPGYLDSWLLLFCCLIKTQYKTTPNNMKTPPLSAILAPLSRNNPRQT
jgi:hypothetical protein